MDWYTTMYTGTGSRTFVRVYVSLNTCEKINLLLFQFVSFNKITSAGVKIHFASKEGSLSTVFQ